uniref:Uncharacterized protein n=1 Tax=Sphaerodactylus townsendi TaxID=933632 RepID=A0ACB8FB73_9SAUR
MNDRAHKDRNKRESGFDFEWWRGSEVGELKGGRELRLETAAGTPSRSAKGTTRCDTSRITKITSPVPSTRIISSLSPGGTELGKRRAAARDRVPSLLNQPPIPTDPPQVP